MSLPWLIGTAWAVLEHKHAAKLLKHLAEPVTTRFVALVTYLKYPNPDLITNN